MSRATKSLLALAAESSAWPSFSTASFHRLAASNCLASALRISTLSMEVAGETLFVVSVLASILLATKIASARCCQYEPNLWPISFLIFNALAKSSSDISWPAGDVTRLAKCSIAISGVTVQPPTLSSHWLDSLISPRFRHASAARLAMRIRHRLPCLGLPSTGADSL